MGLSATERQIDSLLEQHHAKVTKQIGSSTYYSIPLCTELFLRYTGKTGSHHTSANQLAQLERMLRKTRATPLTPPLRGHDTPTTHVTPVMVHPPHHRATAAGASPQTASPASKPHVITVLLAPAVVPPSPAAPTLQSLMSDPDIEELNDTGITVKLVRIKPALAIKWLEANTDNRTIREDYVQRVARDLLGGKWKLNGETIIFDATGRLVNGQHRLWMCVEADTSFDSLVVWGVAADSFDTIDIGKPKTIGDFLHTDHEKNANILASVGRLVLFHERKQLHIQKHGKVVPTVAEVRDALVRYPELRESASWATGAIKKVIRPAIAGYMHWACSRKHPVAWEKFAARWVTGANLAPDDPVYLLRKRVLESKGRVTAIDPVFLLALSIKAFNLSLQGRSIGQLSWREGEPFPEIA